MSLTGKIVETTRGIFLPLLLLFSLLPLFSPPTLQAAREEPKRILVLHSYHPDFPWTAGIMAGMKETLAKSEKKVLLHAEYMDTKRYFDDPEYLSRILEETLQHKLAMGSFDLVLLSDNDALDFTLRHRQDLFGGMPIVFCGVNDFHSSMIAGVGGITGVAEIPDYRETLDQALRLHPETREIVVLNSTADVTGRAQREWLEAEAAHLRGRIRIVPWDDLPLEEIAERLRKLSRGTLAVVNTSAVQDRSGRFAEMAESMALFRESSAVPIYSLWKPFLGLGIVGGKLVSMESQGRLAAELALRILGGESPDEIAVIGRGANEFMFDYNELRRFGISLKALPEGSVVINAPPAFYPVSKGQLWVALALMSAVVLALLVNIVWRKRAEEALKEANRELDAFVRTVSHDLRAPLVPILGYADFLREQCRERLDPQSLECLAEISKSATRMQALLEDLLALATAGEVERPATPVSAEDVVNDVVAELSEPLSVCGAVVEVGSLPSACIPQTLLAEIFHNLIGNAVRYAGREGSPIEVGGERSGDLVRFFVRDHGPGIPVEERGRIFDLFFRGASHREVSGTGVGLATVQKIARLYGGRAWVEETEGGGSTFRVEMEDPLGEEG